MKYSRLASTEENRNYKRALILVFVSVLSVILLIVYGIPLAGKVAVLISGLKNGNAAASKNDTTPPAPPKFNSYTDYTNQQTFNISGTAEPGTTIQLTFNDKKDETLTGSSGDFVFPGLTLKDGGNEFWAVSVDASGNTSVLSQKKTVYFDNLPPEVNIDSPADGTKFFGASKRQINIQGSTEVSASITIKSSSEENDRVVVIDTSGRFSYPVTLNSGDNQFIIKATDQAGNSSEKTLTVNFSE